MEAQRTALLGEEGALVDRIRQLEADTEASALRQEREDLLAQMTTQVERWTVLALAAGLLAAARRDYDDAHRPAVIASAEQHLTRLTGGRYHRILTPDGRTIEAIRGSDDREPDLGRLSTGTAQQLYLALRLGLIEQMGTQRDPLPVVMDDILVNFDGERRAAAAASIEALARGRQVLYLTCHDDLPLRADTVIELGSLGPPPAA